MKYAQIIENLEIAVKEIETKGISPSILCELKLDKLLNI